MVRGNWQRRVERTEARRYEAKQKKQRSEEKRLYKSLVQEMLTLFERYSDEIIRRNTKKKIKNNGRSTTGGGGGGAPAVIHIWVDSIPSDAPPILDGIAISGGTGNNSNNSNNNTPSGKKSKRNAKKNNNKAHPRSKQQAVDDDGYDGGGGAIGGTDNMNEVVHTPTLCRSQFFTGKCNNSSASSKGGGGGKKSHKQQCQHVHYNKKRDRTLAEVVMDPKCIIATEMAHPGGSESNSSNNNSTTVQDEKDDNNANNKQNHKKNNNSNDIMDDDPNSIDMMYYLSVDVVDDASQEEEKSSSSINEMILQALTSRSCSIGSIVYLAMNGILIFDRYRNGMIIKNENEFLDFCYYEKDSSSTYNHTSSASAAEAAASSQSKFFLPGLLLDNILTYLGDKEVAYTSMVCKAWNKEIGKTSCFLWKYLLHKHKWTIPSSSGTSTSNNSIIVNDNNNKNKNNNSADDGSSSNNNQQQHELDMITSYREAFVSHYMTVRDINAITTGVSNIITPSLSTPTTGPTGGSQYRNSNNSTQQEELCFQSFRGGGTSSSKKGIRNVNSPAAYNPNHCIGVKIWSTNHSLMAYSHDCSVRLFSGATSSTSSSSSTRNSSKLLCRELVSHRLDPYKNTKRHTCQLVDMDLDDDYIGCLGYIAEGGEIITRDLIMIISRETFLMSDELKFRGRNFVVNKNKNNEQRNDDYDDEEEEGIVSVIDVRQSVLDYVISCTDDSVLYHDENHGIVQLLDYLGNDDYDDNNNDGIEDVQVYISPNIGACGHGLFMINVSVSVPMPLLGEDNNNDDDIDGFGNNNTMLTFLFRKLFVISASSGSIVWMGNSHQYPNNNNNINNINNININTDVAITTMKQYISEQSKAYYSYALISSMPPFVSYGKVSNVGSGGSAFQNNNTAKIYPIPIQAAQLVRNNEIIEEDGWNRLNLRHSPPVIMTASHIVVAETLFREEENTTAKLHKSYLTFYDISKSTTDDDSNNPAVKPKKEAGEGHNNESTNTSSSWSDNYTIIPLDGNVEVNEVIDLRNNHIVALCRVYTTSTSSETIVLNDPPPIPPAEADVAPEENFAGAWFGFDDADAEAEIVRQKISLMAIVIDISSLSNNRQQPPQEIQRLCLLDDLEMYYEHSNNPVVKKFTSSPIKISTVVDSTSHTLAASVWSKGVIMTGQDVRYQKKENDNKKDASSGSGTGRGGDEQHPSFINGNNNSGGGSAAQKNSKKQKKKKTPKKGGKKDGFARGMSLRG